MRFLMKNVGFLGLRGACIFWLIVLVVVLSAVMLAGKGF